MEVSAYFTAESLVATGFEAFKVVFKSRIQVVVLSRLWKGAPN